MANPDPNTLGLLKAAAGERSLLSRLGSWRRSISLAVDWLIATVASLLLGQSFSTQDAWAVDSANGDDANAGTPASPLKTLAELTRRWNGRVFVSSLTTITVELRGTFPAEDLVLEPVIVNPAATVVVSGQMTELQAAKAVTAYTAEAAPTRTTLADGTTDFATYLGMRLRLTTGLAAGSVTWVQFAPALGSAYIGTFINPATMSSALPAVGDQYVIEAPVTQIRSYWLNPSGLATFTMRDVQVGVAGQATRNFQSGLSTSTQATRVFGVEFIGSSVIVRGYGMMSACLVTATALTCISNGTFLHLGACWRGSLLLSGGYHLLSRGVGEGNGTRNAAFVVSNGCVCEYNAPFSVHNSIGSGGVNVLVEDGSQLVGSAAAAVYGTNTAARSAAVRNGCGWSCVTMPSMVSAGAPNELLLGGVAMPWAYAIAVAPNNAYLNSRA